MDTSIPVTPPLENVTPPPHITRMPTKSPHIKTISDFRTEEDQSILLEKKNAGLTGKKLKFVQEYVKDLDAKAAWVRAGYSEGTANKVFHTLAEPAVELAVTTLLRERRAKQKLTVDLVVKSFLRIANAAEAESNWANALRAWENLARYLGMFVERSETNLSVEERAGGNLEEMTASIKRLLGQQSTTKKPANVGG